MSESGGAVDKRIVQMEFQNEQFEKGVKDSIRSLEDLKKALKIEDTASSLKNIESGLASVRQEISRTSEAMASLERFGQKAFSPIDRFIQRTKDSLIQWPADQLVKVFNNAVIKPLRDGMDEYEEKMTNVQTLTNAVKWTEFGGDANAAMEAVNASLDRLNTYADKTIYSFKDMTTAFAKFVQQSDLKTAEDSIVGLYNASAYYGLNKQQGSMVSYNMAQALGKGHMDLLDWHSFENATMGNRDVKEMLIGLGKIMGKIDQYGHIIGATGKKAKKFVLTQESFRDSLQYDWFDSSVMEAWMQLYSGTLPEDIANQMEEMGFQVRQIAVDAELASSEIKSFGQLWDTLGEALGTGWASTFEIMFGDLQTIKTRLTTLGNTLQDIIAGAAEKRNMALKNWLSTPDEEHDYTRQENGVEHITNAFTNLSEAAKAAAEGVGYVMDAISKGLSFGVAGKDGLFKTLAANLGFTPESIDNFTKGIADVMGIFRDSVKSEGVFTRSGVDLKKRGYQRDIDSHLVGEYEETAFANIFDIASAIGTVVGLIKDGIGFIFQTVGRIASSLSPLIGGVLSVAGAIGSVVTNFGRALVNLKIFEKISAILEPIFIGIRFATTGISMALDGISSGIIAISGWINGHITEGLNGLLSVITTIWNTVKEFFGNGYNWLTNFLKSTSIVDTLTKQWERLKNFGKGLWETLFPPQKKGQKSVWDTANEKITNLKEKALKSDTFKSFKKSFEEGVNKVIAKVPGIVDKIVSWLPTIQKGLSAVKSILKGLFTGVLTVGMVAFGGLFTVLKGIWSIGSKVFGKIGGWAKGIWESSHASEKLSAAWEKIKGYGKKIRDTLFPKAPEGQQSAWDQALAKAKEIKNKILGSELFQKIKSKLETGFNNFLTNLPGYLDKMYTWGSNMYHAIEGAFGEDTVLGKIVAKIKRIPAKIGEAWGVVKQAFSNFFKPVEGEDKMTLFERIGARLQALNPILEWIGKEIEKLVGFVLNLISPAAAAESDGETGGIVESVDAVTEEGATAATTIEQKGEETKSKFQAIIDFFTKIKEKLIEIKNKINEFLPEGVTVESLFEKVKGFFKNLNVEKGLGIASAFVGLRGLFKLGSAAGKMGKMFTGFGKMGVLLGKNSEGWFRFGNMLNLSGFKDAAEIFAKDSGQALKTLMTEGPKSLVKGMKEWRKAQTAGKTFRAVGAMMLEFSVAIGIIVGVLFALSKLSTRDLIRGGIIILGIATFLGIVAVVAKRIGKGGTFGEGIGALNGFQNMLISFGAIALGIIGLLVVMHVLSNMNPEKMIVGIVALGAILLELAIFSRLLSKGNKFKNSSGAAMSSVLPLALGLLALVGVLALLGNFELEDLGKSIIALGGILLELAIFSRLMSKSFKGSGILGLGLGLMAIVGVITALSAFKMEDLGKSLLALGLIFVELAAFNKLIGKNCKLSGFLSLAVGLLAMVGVLRLLAAFKPSDLSKGLKAMGALLLELGIFMKLSGAGQGGAKQALTNISSAILIVTALFGFVLALRMVSDISTDKIVGFGAGIGAVLLGFSAMLLVLSKIGPMGGISAGATLAGFTTVVGALALFMNGLKELLGDLGIDLVSSIKGGTEVMEAIGEFLGSFAHGLIKGIVGDVKLEDFGNDMNKLVEGIKTFAASANEINDAGLQKGVDAIAKLGESTVSIPKVGLLQAIIGVTDYDSFAQGLTAIGTAMVDFSTSVVGVDPENVESGAKAIKTLADGVNGIPSMGGLMGAIYGEVGYEDFAKGLKSVGQGMVWLNYFTKDLDPENMEHSANIVKTLAEAADTIPTGVSLDKLLVGMTDYDGFRRNLPKLGNAIWDFSCNVKHINNPLSMLNAVNAIKILAEASQSIPASGGGLQALFGETGYDNFATALPNLGDGIASLSDTMKDRTIDLTKVQNVADAIKILAEGAKKIYGTGGWIQKIFGEKDIGTFSDNMPKMAQGLTALCENLGEGYDADTVKAVATGIAGMGEAAKRIPGTGGWMQRLFGEKDIATFSTNMPLVSAGLTQMCINLGASFNEEKVKAAALSLAYIAVAASNIPGEGGALQWFFGEKSLGNFASNMSSLGEGLANISSKVEGKEIKPEMFDGIMGILTKFSLFDSTTSTDMMVGVMNNLSTFGEKLKLSTEYFNGVDLEGFETTVSIYRMLVGMMRDMANASMDFTNFGTVQEGLDNIFAAVAMISEDPNAFQNIGKMGAAFFNGFAGVATDAAQELAGKDLLATFKSVIETDGSFKILGGKIANDLVTGITNGTDIVTTAAGQLGTNLITALEQSLDYANRHDDVGKKIEQTIEATKKTMDNTTVDVPTNDTSFDNLISGFSTAVENLDPVGKGEGLMNKFIEGAKNMFDEVRGAGEGAASNISEPITDLESQAPGWGTNIIQGIIDGLSDGEKLGELDSAMSAITRRISTGVTGPLEEHSPSRLMYRYGMYAVEGLANGLSDYAYLAGNASTKMTESAEENFVSSLSDYSALLASDLNQNPVIRPVLDLSQIRAQAGMVGSMFDTVPLDTRVSRNNPLIDMLSREREEPAGVNPEIYSAVLRLEDRLSVLGEQIAGMQVTIDGGTLVGSIATRMDKTLSNRATLAGRGN